MRTILSIAFGVLYFGLWQSTSLRAQNFGEYYDSTEATPPIDSFKHAFDSIQAIRSDSLRTHGVYVMVTSGFSWGLSGTNALIGGLLDLTVLAQKNVFDLSYSSSSGGSITVGVEPAFDFFSGGPPTVTAERRNEYMAQYGQRISSNVTWTTGLAFVQRTRNTPTTRVTVDAGWFTEAGTYWNYSSVNDSYLAVPISLTGLYRLNSWLGMDIKAQLLVSYKEITGSVMFSFGFGSFPKL